MEMGIPYEMGMLYDIKLPKISWNTINIYLCDRTVSTIALCHRSHFTAWNHTRGLLWDGRIPYAGWNQKICTCFSQAYLASTQSVTQKHWRLATRLTGDYLDQTFTGKLITACRTHDFHPLETCAARRTWKKRTAFAILFSTNWNFDKKKSSQS